MFKLQDDDHSCSPTTIYNALAWAGQTDIYLKEIYESCKTTKDGTEDVYFDRYLRSLDIDGLKIVKKRDPCPIEARNFIRKDNTAIILGHMETWERDGEMHHSLWLSERLAVNLKYGVLYSKDEWIVSVIYETKEMGQDPTIYFLEKK